MKTLMVGMPVTMSDGWMGKITAVDGDFVCCWKDGLPIDGSRGDGSRAFNLAKSANSITKDGRLAVIWTSGKQHSALAAASRALLERVWEGHA